MMDRTAITRTLGRTGLAVSPIGFGAFKIGRNQKTKYPAGYDLPDEKEVERLLNAILDMGITYIDTAPAYGLSEERMGRAIGHRRREFVLATKVGETFENGASTYEFSARSIRRSVSQSLQRLQTDVLDIVFIHAPANDVEVLTHSDAVATLAALKAEGTARAIGLSGKTIEAAHMALDWADVLMVEYHLNDRSHEAAIAAAALQGVGVVVKKGLASGHLDPREAIRFVLANRNVASLVIGGLNLDHIRGNWGIAAGMRFSE